MSTSEHESFFRYTSGRWIWDEDQQLRDRYKVFDVSELQNAAINALKSGSCVSMVKLAEDCARIPNPNAGAPFYTTASEVATMELVRTALEIPVPRVYAWSTIANNPLVDEPGSGPKLAIMKEVASIERKLSSLSFSHYGSIYFANDSVEGALPAEITSDVSSELKEAVAKRFTNGPSANRGFWNKERSTMDISRGPLFLKQTPADYALSVGRREIAWIKRYAAQRATDDSPYASASQRSPEAHIQLLEKFLEIAPHLVDIDKCFLRSVIWHGDLHSSNLFVDDNHISSVIDWQGVWAGPLFLQAKPSPLVDYQGSILLKRPENFDDLDEGLQVEIKQQIARSTLFQLYLIQTEEENPTLARCFHLDHGKTRRLPVEYAGDTWIDDIVSFREALINVERYWTELGLQGECPIHFTKDDLKNHLQEAEGWNEVQDFFDRIEGVVKRDAVKFFSDLRNAGLQNVRGEERKRLEKETRWVDTISGRK
ncbi:kinase-like domain-containing protein [Aspergillus californicus]